ncbi:DNA-binding transcriptional regulator AraC [compost metagenome]
MRIRIETALEQIIQSDDIKISELAEKMGFGDNPQYFSKAFKKMTGYSPSEYKKLD